MKQGEERPRDDSPDAGRDYGEESNEEGESYSDDDRHIFFSFRPDFCKG